MNELDLVKNNRKFFFHFTPNLPATLPRMHLPNIVETKPI